MGLFDRYNKGDEVYDADEYDELETDSALFVEAQPLRSASFTVYPKDIYDIDTNALLESLTELPFEFRYYMDAKRAFAKALRELRDEVAEYESYEGGRSASYDTEFEFDEMLVAMHFSLSKDNDSAPFAFSVDIKIYE